MNKDNSDVLNKQIFFYFSTYSSYDWKKQIKGGNIAPPPHTHTTMANPYNLVAMILEVLSKKSNKEKNKRESTQKKWIVSRSRGVIRKTNFEE